MGVPGPPNCTQLGRELHGELGFARSAGPVELEEVGGVRRVRTLWEANLRLAEA